MLSGCMLPPHRGFRLRVYFCTKMPATLEAVRGAFVESTPFCGRQGPAPGLEDHPSEKLHSSLPTPNNFPRRVLMTIVGLIFNTSAVSRIPLPLRLMSTICSLIAGHVLCREDHAESYNEDSRCSGTYSVVDQLWSCRL